MLAPKAGPTESADDKAIAELLSLAHQQYNSGKYREALTTCESIYQREACRTDNLLLFGAVHFQMRNFSECIFYNQQCVRVDPNFAEAYSNLGNALKELGDVRGAIQFYLKVGLKRLRPRTPAPRARSLSVPRARARDPLAGARA